MPNPIPQWRREQVRDRDNGHCIRCGGRGAECHHRRGRRIRDTETHCSCNLVTLCRTCHSWVHANPLLAMPPGYIVSRYVAEPFCVPVVIVGHPWKLDCEGSGKLDVQPGM